MQSIPHLLLPFDLPLQLYEVPAFRGAVLQQVPPVETMHNHTPQQDQYAVVQYKSLRGKAAILMLGQGVDAASRLLLRTRWEIELRGRAEAVTAFAGISPQLSRVPIGTLDRPQRYRLHHWLPLNQKQYLHYREKERLLDRIALLEERLQHHLSAFFSGVGCPLPELPQAHILDTSFFRQQEMTVKRRSFLCFHLDFETHLALPAHIGLGAKTAFGFGTVEKLKNRRYDA